MESERKFSTLLSRRSKASVPERCDRRIIRSIFWQLAFISKNRRIGFPMQSAHPPFFRRIVAPRADYLLLATCSLLPAINYFWHSYHHYLLSTTATTVDTSRGRRKPKLLNLCTWTRMQACRLHRVQGCICAVVQVFACVQVCKFASCASCADTQVCPTNHCSQPIPARQPRQPSQHASRPASECPVFSCRDNFVFRTSAVRSGARFGGRLLSKTRFSNVSIEIPTC